MEQEFPKATEAEENTQAQGPKTSEAENAKKDDEKTAGETSTMTQSAAKDGPSGMSMPNFGNMDFNQMMQFANANGMNAFNPMMGKPSPFMPPCINANCISGFPQYEHDDECYVTRHVRRLW